MSFKNKNLGVLAYAQGFTLWHYKTDDSVSDVEKDGYFTDEVRNLMNIGDIIIINGGDTNDMVFIKSLVPMSVVNVGSKQ